MGGNFASVDPEEPAAHLRIAAVGTDGPGSATLVRRMVVERGRSVPRAANPGRPDMEVIRDNETMIRAVAVFVGRTVRGARPVTTGRRPEAAGGAFRGMSPGAGVR